MTPNVLANLRQVSGAVVANARTVKYAARRQVQRFVRPHRAMGSTAVLPNSGNSFDDSRVSWSAAFGQKQTNGVAGMMHPIYDLGVLELERSSDEYA